MQGELLHEYSSCEYCVQTHYEWDTGYSEYGCTLGDANPDKTLCCDSDCPLDCKYEVTEDE